MALDFDGLSRRYGDVVALDDLSFTVPAGEVVGFLGPNGSGKTTTMRAVFGLVALDSGSVRWNGQPIDRRVASPVRIHARGAGPVSGHGRRRAAAVPGPAARAEQR